MVKNWFRKFKHHNQKYSHNQKISLTERISLPRNNGGKSFENLENVYKQVPKLKKYFFRRSKGNELFWATTNENLSRRPLNPSNREEIYLPNTLKYGTNGLKQTRLQTIYHRQNFLQRPVQKRKRKEEVEKTWKYIFVGWTLLQQFLSLCSVSKVSKQTVLRCFTRERVPI